jgi:hypothetical protein
VAVTTAFWKLIMDAARIAAVRAGCTALLLAHGLEKSVQILAVGACGEVFEALVILPALSRICWRDVVRFDNILWRRVGTE